MNDSAPYKTAFTGHRDLRDEDLETIRRCVRERFESLAAIAQADGKQPVLWVGDAEGADRIGIEVAAELGWKIHLLETDRKPKEHTALDDLLQTIPAGKLVRQKVEATSAKDEPAVFQQIGERILADAKVLVALWNGVETGRLGGTGEVVAEARRIPGLTCWQLATPRRCHSFPMSPAFLWEVDPPRATAPRRRKTHVSALPLRIWIRENRGLIVLTVLTIGLGMVGFLQFQRATGNAAYGWLDSFYTALGLPFLETISIEDQTPKIPLVLEIARVLALGFPVYVVFKILVRMSQRFKVWVRTRSLGFRSGFTLIVGLSEVGVRLAEDLAARGERVLVMDPGADAARLDAMRSLGVPVYEADPLDRVLFARAVAPWIKRIFLTLPEDRTNLTVGGFIDSVLPEKTESVEVYLLSHDEASARLCPLLDAPGSKMRLTAFSPELVRVRELLVAHPVESGAVGVPARALVWGDTGLAERLFEELLRSGIVAEKHGLRLSWLTSDPKARAEASAARLSGCYEPKEDSGAVRLLPREGWNHLPVVEFLSREGATMGPAPKLALMDAIDAGSRVHVFFALESGMEVVDRLLETAPLLDRLRRERGADVRCFYDAKEVFVEPRELLDRLGRSIEKDSGEPWQLPLFPILSGEAYATLEGVRGQPFDDFAKLVNYLYTEWESRPEETTIETMSDSRIRQIWADAERYWDDASEVNRLSSRRSADHFAWKLRALGLTLHADPTTFAERFAESRENGRLDRLCRVEHDRWAANYFVEGWVLGAERRKLEKVHHLLIPWRDLPEDERTKDRRIVESIPWMLSVLRALGR